MFAGQPVRAVTHPRPDREATRALACCGCCTAEPPTAARHQVAPSSLRARPECKSCACCNPALFSSTSGHSPERSRPRCLYGLASARGSALGLCAQERRRDRQATRRTSVFRARRIADSFCSLGSCTGFLPTSTLCIRAYPPTRALFSLPGYSSHRTGRAQVGGDNPEHLFGNRSSRYSPPTTHFFGGRCGQLANGRIVHPR